MVVRYQLPRDTSWEPEKPKSLSYKNLTVTSYNGFERPLLKKCLQYNGFRKLVLKDADNTMVFKGAFLETC